MSFELTPEQEQAVRITDRHLVVRAGPGAGKTSVLVERALRLIESGSAEFDHIAAITFTNKAANEMRERIRARLSARARGAASREEAHYWLKLKHDLEYARITTFHGFSAGILRAHPVEAKVDPQFTLLDEHEASLLLFGAAEEVVNNMLEKSGEIAARMITGFTRSGLAGYLVQIYTALRGLGISIDRAAALSRAGLAQPEDYRKCLRELAAAIGELEEIEGLTANARARVEELRLLWQELSASLPESPALEAADEIERLRARLEKSLPEARGRASQRIKGLKDRIKNGLENLKGIFYDCCSAEALELFIRGLADLDKSYAEIKRSMHSLDYDDLQWKALELFDRHPWLARRYSARLRFLLVDEYQDTNSLQKSIVEKLAFSEQARQSNVFVVGDPMQSIYNFRGAAVEVFQQTADGLERRGAQRIVLAENFRSRPELIRFFNAFFSELFVLPPDGDRAEAERLGFAEYEAGRAARPTCEELPAVELLLWIPEDRADAEEGREREAELLAHRIRNMVEDEEPVVFEPVDGDATVERRRPARYGDIAVLFRAMTDIKLYEAALRRLAVPYQVLAGRGFYQREEVQDMLSLLQFLENRTDEIALAASLRSPLFGISDESLYRLRASDGSHERGLLDALLARRFEGADQTQRLLLERAADLIQHFLRLRNRIPLADLLREILNTTQYAAIQATHYDGYQRVANLNKLLELAGRFQTARPYFLRDFIGYVRQFSQMETAEPEAEIAALEQNAVSIMTIHKAKGLEYPVVIVADIARQLTPRAAEIAFDRAAGIGMKLPDARGRRRDTALYTKVIDNIARRESFENQRLLLVAATRARDYLIFSGAAGGLRQIASPLDGRSFLDWLAMVLPLDQAAPGIIEWRGVKIKISTAVESLRIAPPPPAIERYPEARRGLPIATSAAGDDERTKLQALSLRLAPLPTEVERLERPVAASLLISFACCPRQYYYRALLNLSDQDKGKPGAAARGQVMHRFCQLYDGKTRPEALLDRILAEEKLPAESLAEMRGELLPLALRYARSSLCQDILGRPSVSEAPFYCLLGPALIAGRIDRLVLDGDGKGRLIEFKAGAVEAGAELPLEYRLQVSVYLMAAQAVYGIKDAKGLIYYIETETCFEREPDPEDEKRLLEAARALSRLSVARRMDEFPAEPNPWRCRRCLAHAYCSAAILNA